MTGGAGLGVVDRQAPMRCAVSCSESGIDSGSASKKRLARFISKSTSAANTPLEAISKNAVKFQIMIFMATLLCFTRKLSNYTR
jgi:hypothetical protein